MLKAIRTSRFRKDLKRMTKRRKDLNKLKAVVLKLLNQQPLETRYKDHVLIGNYGGRRECHIEPDWLLIYEPLEGAIIFERTGTHADLFK